MTSAVPPPTMTRLRQDCAALGMFFGLREHSNDEGWSPVSQLYDHNTDALPRVLATAAERLGGVEARVAASVFYQGYVSRLLSPSLACMALGQAIPIVRADQWRWRLPHDQLIELAAEQVPGTSRPRTDLLFALLSEGFDQHLEPLAKALRYHVPVSADLLRGNASAAVVSGLRLLAPQLGTAWRELVELALRHPRLRGTGGWTVAPQRFVRRSCCLFYRTGGGLCGDCPLESVPGGRR